THSDAEPCPYVTILLNRNIEIVRLVTCVWIVTAKIKIDAAAAKTRASQPPIDRILGRNVTDALRSAHPDRVSRDQRLERTHRFRKVSHELITPPLESSGQVHHQTPDAEVARRHPPARGRFDQVQYLFTLPEAIEEDRHCADIESVRPKPDHVRGDTLQFAHQYANNLSAIWNF